jgi:hypothetical protein
MHCSIGKFELSDESPSSQEGRDPYFLNFMFNPLPGRIGAKIEQMRQERKLRFWEIGRVEHAGGGPSTYSSSTNTVSNAWFYTETGTGESTLYPNESCRVWTICLIPSLDLKCTRGRYDAWGRWRNSATAFRARRHNRASTISRRRQLADWPPVTRSSCPVVP